MSVTTDHQLLREFADRGDQRAFARLVERHLPLVLSAARRKLGDASLAEDVAQQVFTTLAQRAPRLSPEVILSGWLYRTACHLAARTQRTEVRRASRERFAAANMTNVSSDSVWRDIEPELDEAMESLGETDRDAVVLRYFENKSLREVGQALGSNDDAAQKRLSRAVEKLRGYFTRRGRPITAASLTGAIVAGAITPVPSALAVTVSAAVLSDAALLTITTTTTTAAVFTMSTVLKPAIAGVVAVAAAAGLAIQHHQLKVERAGNAALQAHVAELATAAPDLATERPSAPAGLPEPERAELLRLRGEVARLRKDSAQLRAALANNPPIAGQAISPAESSPTSGAVDPTVLHQKIDVLKHVGLALRILNTEAESKPELQALKFNPDAPLPKELLETLGPMASSLDQIDLLVPDVKWMLKAELNPQVVVARSREAMPTADGGFIRAYSLGDGSVQSVRHTNPDEAYGWGQNVDGTPVQWAGETPQPALIIDPVLARRYGLQPAGR